jgi:hypothetical protein
MAARNSRLQRLSDRRIRRDDHPKPSLPERTSGRNLYPSSFYRHSIDNGNRNSVISTDNDKKKSGGPLILPPPQTFSTERKKSEPESLESKGKPLKRKKEDEIISLPEDDDELLYKKTEMPEIPPSDEEVMEDKQEESKELNVAEIEGESLLAEKEEPDICEKKKEECRLDKSAGSSKYIRAQLPVVLIKEDVTLDIFDSFTLLMPLSSITKIEWSVHHFKGCAALPSDKLFLELVLCADLEFISQKNGRLQTVKIYVPLQRTVKGTWISEPELPFTRSVEYDFTNNSSLFVSTHRVWEEKLVSPIKVNLESFSMISHDEVKKSKHEKSLLGALGTAKITIEAVQEQTVTLQV